MTNCSFKSKLYIFCLAIGLAIQPLRADKWLEPYHSPLTLDEDGRPIIHGTLHTLVNPGRAMKFRFILDTGSTHCVLDSSISGSFFWEEGVNGQIRESTGRGTALPVVVIKRLEAGGMTRDGIPALRMDLKGSTLGRFQDDPVDGILGMSFLQGTRFVLDLARKQVEWWQKPRPDGVTLPLIFRSGKVPLVRLSVDGKGGECVLDTAMGGGLALPRSLRPEGQGRFALTQGATDLKQTGDSLRVAEVVAGGSAAASRQAGGTEVFLGTGG